MSKFSRIFKRTLGAALILCLMFSLLATATEDGYITENDPLVSLSYITGVLKPEIEKKISDAVGAAGGMTDAEKEALKKELTESITASVSQNIQTELLASEEFKSLLSQLISEQLSNLSVGGSSGSGEMYTLTLSSGQKLKATGKCEIILQSGSAAVFCPGSTSVKDVTSGGYLNNGDSVVKSHYIEISRNDGSGIVSTWSSTVVAVRGEFTVEG